jgi:hypothetical protein
MEKQRQLRKERMLASLKAFGLSVVNAIKRIASLPEGVYPCRVLGVIVTVEDEIDGKKVERPFCSWDGFRLNAEKNNIEITLGEKEDDALFAEPTPQVGVMFECIAGKYGESHAHIPARFNLIGYKRKSDYSDQEWLASGLEEHEGYAVQMTPEGEKVRIVDEKRTKQAVSILAASIGAIYNAEANDDGTPYDQIDLQIDVEDGLDLFGNVVMKKDLKDPKGRIVPLFINEYNADKATYPVVAEEEPAETEKAEVLPD